MLQFFLLHKRIRAFLKERDELCVGWSDRHALPHTRHLTLTMSLPVMSLGLLSLMPSTNSIVTSRRCRSVYDRPVAIVVVGNVTPALVGAVAAVSVNTRSKPVAPLSLILKFVIRTVLCLALALKPTDRLGCGVPVALLKSVRM